MSPPSRLHRRRVSLPLVAALLSLAFALAGCGDEASKQAGPPSAETQRFIDGETLWRAQRREALVTPDGWTTLVGLHRLTLKSHYVGSSERSGMRLAVGPASLGMFTRNGPGVIFTPERGLVLTLDGQPLTAGRVSLRSDLDGAPSVLGFDDGRGQLTVIDRGGDLFLRVKHADALTRTGFKELDYWPPQPDWRIEATFVPHPAGTTLQAVNLLGQTETLPNPGALAFQRDGRSWQLELIDEGSETLTVLFADATSGHETYGQGRRIDVLRPDAGGKVVLDFNRAYNPPAAFTLFTTCTTPPVQNRLDMPIRAGEKLYGGPR
mgnify:CR=1 FL=1